LIFTFTYLWLFVYINYYFGFVINFIQFNLCLNRHFIIDFAYSFKHYYYYYVPIRRVSYPDADEWNHIIRIAVQFKITIEISIVTAVFMLSYHVYRGQNLTEYLY